MTRKLLGTVDTESTDATSCVTSRGGGVIHFSDNADIIMLHTFFERALSSFLLPLLTGPLLLLGLMVVPG